MSVIIRDPDSVTPEAMSPSLLAVGVAGAANPTTKNINVTIGLPMRN